MFKKLRGKLRRLGRIVRVGTYNFGDGPDARKLNDLVELADAGVEILGCVEHADRSDVTDEFVRLNKGWGKWDGDGRPGAQKVCILWRIALGPVTAKKSRTLSDLKRVPKGAGPENPAPKVANRIRLRIGRKRVHFICGHQYATVRNRREAARLFLTSLTDLVRQRVGIIIVVGDFNDKPSSAMLKALHVLLPKLAKTGPTHGNRRIDLIWARGAEIINAWTMSLTSDHEAVLADIKI